MPQLRSLTRLRIGHVLIQGGDTVMFLRGGLVSIQHRSLDRVELHRRMKLLGSEELGRRISVIGDPILRDSARKLGRACWVTL